MFKPREQFASGPVSGFAGGPYDGAAALSHTQIMDVLPTVAGSWRERAIALRHRCFAKIEGIEISTDLAEDIGSARWFRGFGTMLGLGIAAIAFWPGFEPLEAAPAMTIDAMARDEFRSQLIMPLAYGADSGRHMAPTDAVIALKAAPERPRIAMVATFAQGDSFDRMLLRAGVGSADADRVAALVSQSVPLGSIKPGTKVDIVLGQRSAAGQARSLESLSFRARFDLDLSVQRSGGALALASHPISVDTTPLRIRGKVGNSLYRSARAAGASLKTVQQYLRTLDSHLRIDGDVAPDDTFDMVLSFKRSAAGETQVGDLLFAGLDGAEKPKAQLLKWGKDGQFYEASGVGQQQTGSGLIAPVAGRITSRYGLRRHPILGYTRMHSGMDFGARYGSPIYAVSDGTVSFAGRHGGHGNYVRINHGGGFGTGYAHMSRIAVSPGSVVQRGQVIGYVGSTGLSTGPHLHYEAYRNGKTVDPASVSFVMRAQLSGPDLEAFRARLRQLKALPADASPRAVMSPAPIPTTRIAHAGN